MAPLRFGAGVKGKIVEAMYHGVPSVTTTVGAEGIGDAERALFIADDASSFADKVVQAYTCSATWNKAALLSQQAIRQHFSRDAALAILSQDMPP